MIGKATQKLIIVCDEKTESYANYLRQLISTNDDKDGQVVGVEDGTVNVAVWLEKDYLANKAQHLIINNHNSTLTKPSIFHSVLFKLDDHA